MNVIIDSVKKRLIQIIVLTAFLPFYNSGTLFSQPFKLFGVSDLVRVFEDGYNLPPQTNSINIFGIRGEIISGQFIIHTKKDLENVSLEISAFENQLSGKTLNKDIAELNFVGSVSLTENTPNQPMSVLTRTAPAKFPDYLMSEKEINILKKKYQSVWLTVQIPENAESGTFSGKVTVKSNIGEQTLPVNLTIFPLNMPEERNLKVTEWYNTRNFSKVHGINEQYSPEWFAMLKKYAENMVEHRQNVFRVPAGTIEIYKSATDGLEFDFTRFDQIAEIFWSTGKMDYLETGEFARFGPEGWVDEKIFPGDFNVKDLSSGNLISLPGEKVLPILLPALESHLRQKGWLNKTLFHVKDEPSQHNVLSWIEFSRYIHNHAPDLKRIDAVETPYLLDDIEIVVPKLDHFNSWYDTYKKAPDKGVELWFYTVGIFQGSLLPNKTIDMPLIDSRIMHWLNYKYDAKGYLHWGWNAWNENPFHETGKHIGDGWHVYPAKNGVMNSLRWEQMRNGIQDYECFLMLEKRISTLKDSLGAKFKWIDPKHRSKEILDQVVKGFTDKTNDPDIFYKIKLELLKELLEFDISPMIYFQTEPAAGSTLTEHSSVAAYGWTEPGTKVIINGNEIPVNNDGLFLTQFGGDFIDKRKLPLGNKITIIAVNEKGKKEINRIFIIK